MNRIFLDIGNSRIKYAVSENGNYEYLGAEAAEDFLQNIDELLFAQFDVIDEVYYSTVGSLDLVEEIKALIHEEWQLIPIQLGAQKKCCGLESGYKDFHKLGADRWMVMQAGMSLTKDPFIVVDAGTAVTVDAVVDGVHKGGFIVPGLSMMHQSLAKDTSQLEIPNLDTEDSNGDELLANNTSGAILAGTLYMSGAFINHLLADLNRQMGTQFKAFLTGGDATQLAPLLDFRFAYIPDLVLLGMVSIVDAIKKS